MGARRPVLGRAAMATVALIPVLAPGQAFGHACATLVTYTFGAPTTYGPHCQPALDDRPHICQGVGRVLFGFGADADACLPSPPVRHGPQ